MQLYLEHTLSHNTYLSLDHLYFSYKTNDFCRECSPLEYYITDICPYSSRERNQRNQTIVSLVLKINRIYNTNKQIMTELILWCINKNLLNTNPPKNMTITINTPYCPFRSGIYLFQSSRNSSPF